MTVELVLDAGAELGEGPVWDDRSNRLVWVDILAGRVHRFDPATGADEVTEVGQPVGAVALRERGGLVLAVRDGFMLIDEGIEAAPRLVTEVEANDAATRMNDGDVDPAGRFWARTMAFDETPGCGYLYRLDHDLTVAPVLGPVSVSNGLGSSPDECTTYYVDTPTRRIDAFDWDRVSGDLANRRTLVEIDSEAGTPDGLTVDAEGCLWVAMWGGWALHRYTASGELDRVVELPVSQVTSCTFGGAGLDELYVTSGWTTLDDEQRRAQPHAGGVFRLRPGVRGLPARRFAA